MGYYIICRPTYSYNNNNNNNNNNYYSYLQIAGKNTTLQTILLYS